MTTRVIFRKYKKKLGGDIIALFPEIVATLNFPKEIQSYQHLGQHGGAVYGIVMNDTKLAKPFEYADLLQELKQIGYDDLEIYSRETPHMRDEFQKEFRRLSSL